MKHQPGSLGSDEALRFSDAVRSNPAKSTSKACESLAWELWWLAALAWQSPRKPHSSSAVLNALGRTAIAKLLLH